MDDCGAGPGEQGRHHKTDTLARARRGKAQHMLRTVMPEIGAAPAAQQHAVGMEKPGLANLACLRPPRGAIGRDLLYLPRTPDGHSDRYDEGRYATGPRDEAAGDEDLMGIGVISEPPPEKGGWLVDRPSEEGEPGLTEAWLKVELPGGPFRRCPEEEDDDTTDEENLAPENLGRIHGETS